MAKSLGWPIAVGDDSDYAALVLLGSRDKGQLVAAKREAGAEERLGPALAKLFRREQRTVLAFGALLPPRYEHSREEKK